jgi:hypothetical protein
LVKELVRKQVVCRVFSYLLVTFPLLNSRGILKKVELAQVKQGKLIPCRGHNCIIPDDDFSPYMCAASFAHAWVSYPYPVLE